MQEDIKISICIPTYNKYETIEYTILSVINQSYKKFELLIIDDSNNNYTEEIVEKFSLYDSRIHYLKNNERLGLVRNWNECIKQAHYEYIYILHHDDFLMPGVLNEYNQFVLQNPQCGIVHSNCYYVTLPYFRKSIGITQNSTIIEKGDKAVEKILFNNNLACSSVMVKKKCYEELGGFDENAWTSPDWEMWARIGKYYDLGHLSIFGCSVVLDNKNTHLSSIEVMNLYKQQQYYYNKIVSYFTSRYIKENPLIKEKAEENLKNTILGLSVNYASQLKIKTSYLYIKKIQFRKIYKIPFVVAKGLIRISYLFFFKNKCSYGQAFELIYNSKDIKNE